MKFLNFILDVIYPNLCIGCGKEGEIICEKCLKGMRRFPFFTSGENIRAFFSPFIYDGLAREAVHLLKYEGLKVLSKPMGEEMGRLYAEKGYPVDVIVPVPLHKKRLKERGYNQAELLAREVGSFLGVPVGDFLTRERYSKPQVELSGDERRINVRGVFKACGDVCGMRILLIDDVITTGSTMEECGRALLSRGALEVYGLTFAREV